MGEPIAGTSRINGDWKKSVAEWESLLSLITIAGLHDENGNRPSLRDFKLKVFLTTIFQGTIMKLQGTDQDWLGANVEYYLIWSSHCRHRRPKIRYLVNPYWLSSMNINYLIACEAGSLLLVGNAGCYWYRKMLRRMISLLSCSEQITLSF